jgi:hypothetical protein
MLSKTYCNHPLGGSAHGQKCGAGESKVKEKEKRKQPPSYSSKTTENKISPAAPPPTASLAFLCHCCMRARPHIYTNPLYTHIELMKQASQQGGKETTERKL